MTELAFVRSRGQNLFWVDIAEAVREELMALGVPTSVHQDGFPPPRRGLVYVLAPPHEYFALEGRTHPPRPHLLRRSIFLCGEQPGTPHFEDNLRLSARAGAVFDINRASVRIAARRDVGVHHLQLGWTARWDVHDPAARRDVDALFLGSDSERRTRALATYAPVLARRRAHLLISDNAAPNTASSARFADDAERLALLARTKVLLNVHAGTDPYFEWHRVVGAMLAGTAVVSEHASDFAPLVPGEHLLLGRWETLGHLTEALLEDPAERDRMAEAAYRLLRDEVPLRPAVEQLAAVAADVDRRGGLLPTLERLDYTAPGPPPTFADAFQPAPTHDLDGSMIRRAVKEARLDLMDLRRTLAGDRYERRHGRPAAPLEIVAATPAWRGAERRVSVLTPVYNHGRHIGAAITSVTGGAYRDLELVIVDDGSTDDSGAAVADWMAERPELPVLLLRHPVNRGLPHARNSALAFARGEYVFPLDADNEVLPHGLAHLVDALDADAGASFAYGVLEAFTHEGPHHLSSYRPWEPARLRAGNYIDAMALLRGERLRAHGGYTTERRLYGWEDFALWCSFAERGERGAFVRQFVARYRSSHHSMLALSNIAVTDAFSVLAEMYPTVMAGVRIPA